MKEVRNDVIDNVYLYIYESKTDVPNPEDPYRRTRLTRVKGEIHMGVGVKHDKARFKGYSKKKKVDLYVDPEPGKVHSGRVVWFNEKNSEAAILAFMDYKVDKMDECNERYKANEAEYHALKNLLTLEPDTDDEYA